MKRFALLLIFAMLLSGLFGCAEEAGEINDDIEFIGSLELSYAKNFSIDYCEGGCSLLTLNGTSRFLLVPKDGVIPEALPEDVAILNTPIHNIYLAATSAMSLFDALDALGSIALSGSRAENWYNDNARAAMNAGSIIYAGKYSEPDYELMVNSGCSLAIESTMIEHTPEVKKKLNDLGIPVLIDYSSSENHPLGRTEWIKLYGALLGREEAAQSLFAQQIAYMNEASANTPTGRTVAFFHISSSGSAVVRRTGDYVTKMIELAGGTYVFTDLASAGSGASTITLEMEKFYTEAKNADIIIYNGTIGGEVGSLSELLEKSSLLRDFTAVKNGMVWATGKNLFQETTQLGLMIRDISLILNGKEAEGLSFLYRLE